MKILIFALTLFTTTYAFAGAEGHGGDAIVCKGSSGSIELLDYVEGEKETRLKLDMPDDSVPYQEQIKFILDRLAKMDPVAAARYQKEALTFEQESSFQPGDEIRKVLDDHHEAINPALGCVEDQFAVQFMNPKPLQVRYLVNQDLWAQAKNHTKAGLVLHELIYRDAVLIFKQEDSDNARYFNYVISSDYLKNITADQYLEILNGIGFNSRGFSFTEEPTTFFPQGIVLFAISGFHLAYERPVRLKDGTTVMITGEFLHNQDYKFYSLDPATGTYIKLWGSEILVSPKEDFRVSEDGVIFCFVPEKPIQITYEGQRVEISGAVDLFPGGGMKWSLFTPLDHDLIYKDSTGHKQKIKKNESGGMSFDAPGFFPDATK